MKGGFIGLNFHYLIWCRFAFLQQLQRFSSNAKFDAINKNSTHTTQLRIINIQKQVLKGICIHM